MRVCTVSALLVLGCASLAQASDFLASGPLVGSPNQTLGVCNFYNTGNLALQLSALHIVGPNGGYAPLTGNNCGADLLAHHSCSISGTVNFLPYACIATVSPSKTAFRGVFEMEDGPAGHVFKTTTLR